MIRIDFGRWGFRKTDRFIMHRWTFGKRFWTPFCWISRRNKYVKSALEPIDKKSDFPTFFELYTQALQRELSLAEKNYSKGIEYSAGFINGTKKLYSMITKEETNESC